MATKGSSPWSSLRVVESQDDVGMPEAPEITVQITRLFFSPTVINLDKDGPTELLTKGRSNTSWPGDAPGTEG